MDPRASLAAAISTASDGFFLNLSWVLLRLCAPFSSQGGGVKRSARIASIDPTYCTVAGGSESAVVDFRGDSKLVPGDVCVCVYAHFHLAYGIPLFLPGCEEMVQLSRQTLSLTCSSSHTSVSF